ncbi:uncharacterized protein K452DRAFT_291542 [Aplosporella prunicola CBS 121167]|uniref:Uncharacterized protein n=1 Tax=Aplosporella prunicola CBS 121167 TaxID=1176127 RepID=A0A6A6B0W7_9PEZI|nr:uncharacterized protein K452DRAFT_291542 [Aplosporella prunicola CBS 121167]KAF2137496.1 hypothetical protein K452DRAFT_291542 [Aplosporella prunicola CBS 121167]
MAQNWLVAYTAWRQARDAYAIGKKLQGYLYGDKSTKRHPWTSMHGFYAVMGGFAFDTELTGQRIMPGGRTRLTHSTWNRVSRGMTRISSQI